MEGRIREAARTIMTSVAEKKQRVRAAMRATLRQMSPGEILGASEKAVRRLEASEIWQQARTILAYSATGHELDLAPALGAVAIAGKILTMPRYDSANESYCAAVAPLDPRSLTQARYGIPEPPAEAAVIPPNRLDLVLVPGLAFDLWGRRLGRGKGFYDRLLSQVTGVKCGIALDEQIVDELPAEIHDISMNVILTPTRWLTLPAGT